MNLTAESLANSVVGMLILDPPPAEAEIDEVLNRLAGAFGASPDLTRETRTLLHSRFAITMDRGETLVGSEEHAPWLGARRSGITPFYWERYRELLIRSGWSPLVAGTLDRSTDDVLDLLGNPENATSWKRRGLVVGDVQSGKTASYAALICKAADAGYRMVILLTGTLENVRRQTQERLDEAFIGFDSRTYLDTAKFRQKQHVGVGLIDGQRDGVVFTSRDQDFRKRTASALNIALGAVREPVLVVTKKNKTVLERLASWLSSKNADRDGKISLPLLLIDDEADNASINTRNNPDRTTAINEAIRQLLSLFRQSSYVGFTATPFANIFIDPASRNQMLGDDLFPRDFIHLLIPPSNYVGMHVLFPEIDPEEADHTTQDLASTCIREIDDEATWLPVDHDKDVIPGPLPFTLLEALRCFLLSCAIRDLRAVAGSEGRGGGIHRSMLVNVSRFTAVQNKVAGLLHLELEDIRRSARLYGKLASAKSPEASTAIAELQKTFEEEFKGCGCSWPEVLGVLSSAIGPVQVQAVNQSSSAGALDYGAMREAPGLRVVAVGGNSLSRGLTLEGLSTSYFIRNSKGYDTLLQMGRWFGYRGGYGDLCRLWLTLEAETWYLHVAGATAELKRDFSRMRRRRATPEEFGLRVRTHPETLLITARNKMASGLDVEIDQDVSMVGRMAETARLYADTVRNRENHRFVEQFLEGLVARCGRPEQSPHGGACLWLNVPAEAVANFLEAFLIHPMNFDFQGDSIAEYLKTFSIDDGSDLSRWTVALLTGGKGTPMQ